MDEALQYLLSIQKQLKDKKEIPYVDMEAIIDYAIRCNTMLNDQLCLKYAEPSTYKN